VSANAFNTMSIVLAGRNNVHTWWTGLVGCLLFGWVFFAAKLYADVTLQAFFVLTGLQGWRRWRRGSSQPLSVTRTPLSTLLPLAAAGLGVVVGYGHLLHRFTDAYAPFVDSAILAFSVLGQLLLIERRIETWGCWLLVNSLAVPVYWLRGLQLTSLLYAVYWVNAVISFQHWRVELAKS
ncbi:MAG TPA: nicotinamide riboside transporter PnuC, partial [Polyangiaceae bacterium]|nr:nicotinamide riboside transporter PnuC [Polyangiaceae bacterium]